jgi:hypothetical protein
MDCKYCNGPVDDPFWDDTCHECKHELFHGTFDANCSMCLADADDAYQQGDDFDNSSSPENWAVSS